MPPGRLALVLLTVASCTPLAEFENTVADIGLGSPTTQGGAMTLRLSADRCPSALLRASLDRVQMRQTDTAGSSIANWGGGSPCTSRGFALDSLDDIDPSAPLGTEVTDGATSWTVGDARPRVRRLRGARGVPGERVGSFRRRVFA